MSLNPLEVGMALDSPILKVVNSNSCRSQIVHTIGPRKVKYGGQFLKKPERSLMNESASVNGDALMNESASLNGNALMSESASVNETDSTSEIELIDLNKQLPRLRLELSEDDEGNDQDCVITPRPGDLFC